MPLDSQEFARAIRRLQVRKLNPIRDGLLAVVLLGFGVLLWTWGQSTFAVALFGVGGFLLLGLAFAVFITPVLVSRGEPKLLEPYDLTFSPAGVHFRTPTIDSNLKWSTYSSWHEDERFFYLSYAKRGVTILPTRAFSSPETLRDFRKLLGEHIGMQG